MVASDLNMLSSESRLLFGLGCSSLPGSLSRRKGVAVAAKPTEPIHSPHQAVNPRQVAWAVGVTLVAIFGFVYFPLFSYSFEQWLKPDYSHAFLVPVFAGYVAWTRRALAPKAVSWPDTRGIWFILGAAVLFPVAGQLNIGKEWLQGVSFILSLFGATLLLGGTRAVIWLWPSLGFLIFLFPLPYAVEHYLGWQLQRTAAIGAGYALQTIGYPTYCEGVILHCQDHILEVQHACNGLSMLLTFAALSVGMIMVVQRPWFDRGLILVSAVPIAVFSNILRIAATGVLYNAAGKEMGDRIFHDFAGWMMMPLALAILLLELKILDWVFLEDLGQASRDDVLRMGGKPAHLFMTSFGGAGNTSKPAPAKPPAPPPPRGQGR